MRFIPAVLALLAVLTSACAQPVGTPAIESLGACLAPASDPNAVSLPALVDRADVIVHATVVRIEAPPTPSGAVRDLVFGGGTAGQRVTLRAIETAKGSVPSEFAVYDSPCPVLGAKPGESLVVLLDGAAYPDGTLRPIGPPVSALRATPDRSIAQVMSAMRAIRALDGDARALLAEHSWKVNDGKYAVDEFTLPAAADFGLAGRQFRTNVQLAEPFERYATLSAAAGLDLRLYAGDPAELLTFLLEGKRGEDSAPGAVFGHVLIADRRIVGAWVSVSPEGTAFSLRDRGAVLMLLATRPGGFALPTNRVPQGVNLTRAYDLTSARGIAYKTGAGQGGEITDPANIRAFADALDVTLATVQATPVQTPVDNGQPRPTLYWFSIDFPSRHLSLQFDASDGMLTVFIDGFSAKAPARFAALVADLR